MINFKRIKNKSKSMVIEKKTKEKITVTFSARVGKKGFEKIKDYIEYLELSEKQKPRKVSQASIDRMADKITAAAWQRLKKERKLNSL